MIQAVAHGGNGFYFLTWVGGFFGLHGKFFFLSFFFLLFYLYLCRQIVLWYKTFYFYL